MLWWCQWNETLICDADDPCSIHTACDPKSSLTMSPRSTTLPLYFWYWSSSSEFSRWQRSIKDAKWNFLLSFLASSITSSLFLTFVRCHASIFSSFPILFHCCLLIQYFQCLRHWNTLVHQVSWLSVWESKCMIAPGCCIARLSWGLSLVWRSFVGSFFVEAVVGQSRPSLFGHRCSVGVLAGTHQCATESRVTLWQSANPCCVLVGVVTSCVCLALVFVHHAHVPLRILTLWIYSFRCNMILLMIPQKELLPIEFLWTRQLRQYKHALSCFSQYRSRFPHRCFLVFCKALLLASEFLTSTSVFHDVLEVLILRFKKEIPRNFLALSRFAFSIAHFCFAWRFDASDTCFH